MDIQLFEEISLDRYLLRDRRHLRLHCVDRYRVPGPHNDQYHYRAADGQAVGAYNRHGEHADLLARVKQRQQLYRRANINLCK